LLSLSFVGLSPVQQVEQREIAACRAVKRQSIFDIGVVQAGKAELLLADYATASGDVDELERTNAVHRQITLILIHLFAP
jgi:hypothetical protein